jgi:hypothetical protein
LSSPLWFGLFYFFLVAALIVGPGSALIHALRRLSTDAPHGD